MSDNSIGFPCLDPTMVNGSTVSRGAAPSPGKPLGGQGTNAIQQDTPRGNQGTGLPHPKGNYGPLEGWNDVHGTEVS